jgi:hypothetical protein
MVFVFPYVFHYNPYVEYNFICVRANCSTMCMYVCKYYWEAFRQAFIFAQIGLLLQSGVWQSGTSEPDKLVLVLEVGFIIYFLP